MGSLVSSFLLLLGFANPVFDFPEQKQEAPAAKQLQC